MDSGQDPQPPLIDMHTPSVARMYDWLLGGVENYASDRDACAKLLEIAPSTQLLARNNRAFLTRVVRTLVEDYGIRQFLDHGSGLPTQDNVHEVAQRADPRCRVAYVDNDPMVLAHAQTTLHDNSGTLVISQDMRETERIRRATDRFLDWEQPIAALFVSVLHCIPDTDDERSPAEVVRRTAALLPPGSFMVICQLVSDDADVREQVTRLMEVTTHGHWGRVRETHEVERYFDGLDILEPRLVDVVDWRPDAMPPPPERRPKDWVEWGGVGRLR
ncbi:SAM-dependent methyltransferase [Streptomyces sp. NBC_00249]|uniref:SAM-dependent methyltransferase n=1 Tax=Streptomyces sp. NBC_00249 TaxID=2975690 RepID=UPI00224D3478|nr:SAM-dependent methyltransferase [Streptomyces sp. NBC_00249]MCX5192793.1 SAM-dependent methyltransferase [Streptomyces sp. NBC_00249]